MRNGLQHSAAVGEWVGVSYSSLPGDLDFIMIGSFVIFVFILCI